MFQSENDFTSIERILGYQFKDSKLLERALTRASVLEKSTRKDSDHNGSLATLGDGALRLIIEDVLLDINSNHTKGTLSITRDKLVNNEIQAKIAKELTLDKYIIKNSHEKRNKKDFPTKTLADCLEAVIGAVFFDCSRNYLTTKRLVVRLWKLQCYYNIWLVEAFNNDHVKAFRYLLECGADPNLVIYGKFSSESKKVTLDPNNSEFAISDFLVLPTRFLYEVSFKTSALEMAEILIKSGADINYTNVFLMNHTMLYNAAYSNNIALTQFLCAHKPLLIPSRGDGYTAFHISAHYGYIDIVKILANSYPESIDTIDMFGRTPLYIATKFGHINVVQYLLEFKAKFNKVCIDKFNNRFETTLHIAAENNDVKIIKLLYEYGARLDVIDHKKQTALHRAVAKGNLSAIEVLIECGADTQATDNNSQKPIDLTNEQNLKKLLTKNDQKNNTFSQSNTLFFKPAQNKKEEKSEEQYYTINCSVM